MGEDIGSNEGLEIVRKFAESEACKDGFVWVYRAEGEHNPDHASGGNVELAGTWFTPSFGIARNIIPRLESQGIKNIRMVAMVIPKIMLEQRDWIEKGMNEINIIFRKKVEVLLVTEEITTIPTAKTYIDQFKFF